VTLLETVIAAAMTVVVLGSIGGAALSGQRATAENLAATELETRARSVVDRIAEEMISARTAGLSPNPTTPFGSSTLTFQKDVGYSGGVAVFGPNQVVRWLIDPGETNNGLDDDRDGMIDEGLVEFTRDQGAGTQQVVRWLRGVPEYLQNEAPNGADDNGNGLIDERGLAFSITGRILTIRLTAQEPGAEGRLLTRTVETSVRLRN